MALVRILVDGYSLLHQWPELAQGKPRHSEAARDELVQMLAGYQDATGTPVSVIFDGGKVPKGRPKIANHAAIEVLFSRSGKTADEVIERVVHRLVAYGEVMVVTDDMAEQQTVFGLGGQATSCGMFIRMIGSTFADLDEDVKNYNRKQQRQFLRPRVP